MNEPGEADQKRPDIRGQRGRCRKRDGPLLSASASHTASKQSGQNLMIYYRCCRLASGTVHWSERNCALPSGKYTSIPLHVIWSYARFHSPAAVWLSGTARKTKKQPARVAAADTQSADADIRNVIRSAIVNVLKSISPQFIFDKYHIYPALIKLHIGKTMWTSQPGIRVWYGMVAWVRT